MRAIMHCRTAALSRHIDICPRCGDNKTISYNSCRNRHCPKCQTQARQRWIGSRKQELLETRYFHVVFTLPRELHSLILLNQAELYTLLFRTVADTLLEVDANSHPLCYSGRRPLAGSRPLDSPAISLLLTDQSSRKVFRGKFIYGLKRAVRHSRLTFAGAIERMAEPKCFSAFLRTLFR
jgi:hypothetical protein